ncbi:hypothetical protein [Shimia sp.]|uniref:hypothetical protein n=1 Tax=Shimia sp. TaxID=1954381 RepID=UPI00356257F6
MPVSFRILKQKGLVYVRYEGVARLEETMQAFADYARHPDCAPGQRQFVDLTALEGIEMDFPKLMETQAQKAGTFVNGAAETLIVYLAPTPLSQSLAQTIVRSWEPFPAVVPVVLGEEREALSVLGLRENSIEKLLAAA